MRPASRNKKSVGLEHKERRKVLGVEVGKSQV